MLGSSAGNTRVRMELSYSGDYDEVTKLPIDLVMFSFEKCRMCSLDVCPLKRGAEICVFVFPISGVTVGI